MFRSSLQDKRLRLAFIRPHWISQRSRLHSITRVIHVRAMRKITATLQIHESNSSEPLTDLLDQQNLLISVEIVLLCRIQDTYDARSMSCTNLESSQCHCAIYGYFYGYLFLLMDCTGYFINRSLQNPTRRQDTFTILFRYQTSHRT